jgi:hypothetical protein
LLHVEKAILQFKIALQKAPVGSKPRKVYWGDLFRQAVEFDIEEALIAKEEADEMKEKCGHTNGASE